MKFALAMMILQITNAQFNAPFYGFPGPPDLDRIQQMMQQQEGPNIRIVPVYIPVPAPISQVQYDNRGGQYRSYQTRLPGGFGQGQEYILERPSQSEYRNSFSSYQGYGRPRSVVPESRGSREEKTKEETDEKHFSTERAETSASKQLKKTLSNWKPQLVYSNFADSAEKSKHDTSTISPKYAGDAAIPQKTIQLQPVAYNSANI